MSTLWGHGCQLYIYIYIYNYCVIDDESVGGGGFAVPEGGGGVSGNGYSDGKVDVKVDGGGNEEAPGVNQQHSQQMRERGGGWGVIFF